MHTVDENVALLDGRLVLSVLRVGSGGDDNSPDFVNLAVQPTIGNELGKLPAIKNVQNRREVSVLKFV